MAANMYRVGDYVYFETSSTTPYQIRRIEELNKTATGNVEAKVMCFYRRRDISSSLIQLADKHQNALEDEEEDEESDRPEGSVAAASAVSTENDEKNSTNGHKASSEDLNPEQKHQLKHRELFLSRQVETLPATHIRGKCAVTLLNETEALTSYLVREDAFFYSLVYDPQQKTLLADKGEIRVGQKYQADVPTGMDQSEERKSEDLEELVWNPENPINDRSLDSFLIVARSVGTFARALDCTSSVRQPSLHMSAAAASRDITLLTAYRLLHENKYELSEAMTSLVPAAGPVLCRDEMEEWSASEANLFEEALDKYGKDFGDIRQDFLPWKSLKSIVEYYYMWKTTDRYVQQKRLKASEAEGKLKQVYIPNYNKPNPAQLQGNIAPIRPCEGCATVQSNVWFMWGPMHMQCRLCGNCWNYWKKYGGLKQPTRNEVGSRPAPDFRQERQLAAAAALAAQPQQQRVHKCTIGNCGKEFRIKVQLARHLAQVHNLAIRSSSPRPVMKTRAAFCLITTPLTRVSRQVCRDILLIRRSARRPFQAINIALIKQECQARLTTQTEKIRRLQQPVRRGWERLAAKIGIDPTAPTIPLLEKNKPRQEPTHYAFPVVPGAGAPVVKMDDEDSQGSQGKKRPLEEAEAPPAAKRPAMQAQSVIRQAGTLKHTQPKPRTNVQQNVKGLKGEKGRKVNWMDQPDDVFFLATDATRKLRKQVVSKQFRKLARKPWRAISLPSFSPTPTSAASN